MFKVGIVGRPNVGKSTFFNKVIGRNRSITSDIAGTTRDSVTDIVEWNGKLFELTDMGGLDNSLKEEIAQAVAVHIKNQLPRFDLLLFMVDAKTGITHVDHENLKLIRKNNIPTWLIVNKCDNDRMEDESAEFYRLGFKKIFTISSVQGRNIAEVLDELSSMVHDDDADSLDEAETVNLAILGRPNVGKSSIFNTMIGETMSQVSDTAGTTRDAVDTLITVGDTKIRLIDTAGLRRPGKIKPRSLEQFSVMRAEFAIERCDIAVVVLDSPDGITHQDQHILSQVIEHRKGMIIAANKWDLIDSNQVTKQHFINQATHILDYLSWATFIFTSAVTGEGLQAILQQAMLIRERQLQQLDAEDLNYWLKATVHKHPMLGSFRGKHVKVFEVEQTSTNPPCFTFYVNYPAGMHFSSRRYLENELRKSFEFTGVGIKLKFKKR